MTGDLTVDVAGDGGRCQRRRLGWRTMPRSSAPEVLTLEETATYLRISKRTLERLLENGAFPPAVKVGQQWRVHRRALDAYLLSGAATPRAASPRSSRYRSERRNND